jgi:hypothetical protein
MSSGILAYYENRTCWSSKRTRSKRALEQSTSCSMDFVRTITAECSLVFMIFTRSTNRMNILYSSTVLFLPWVCPPMNILAIGLSWNGTYNGAQRTLKRPEKRHQRGRTFCCLRVLSAGRALHRLLVPPHTPLNTFSSSYIRFLVPAWTLIATMMLKMMWACWGSNYLGGEIQSAFGWAESQEYPFSRRLFIQKR